MRHVAAYVLLVLGGNASPSADQVAAVVTAAGGEADNEQVEKMLAELAGKDLSEVVEAGLAKIKDVSIGGGGGGGGGGGAAAGGDAAPAAEEKKEEEEEEEADVGAGDMFGGSDY
mmetsp:Transcript_2459/g.3608  ORF Transcript_2459/g.3608 Transcript_2459/m.3608 type:complete len:115 (+) Transcript_2459:90-434(+)|eukprot:CAMPEP_0206380714 /NCGR_PEP_ID=MMETSP0294-20121207/12193_1 /ASSEMBLY_ACC=CAM_ASM_000327 /TAXON_ID=39354 /ORGANISM="Heterosigma akashiwo, Strain CCMP2393" /LENGTH=114 /DNA_ID=CAMNT_0053829985 /DNA_START=72 /DNA_END=416 /DNA_ORIENTATION=-